jgi:hypothetical protein
LQFDLRNKVINFIDILRNSDQSEGSKGRRDTHGRIPDLSMKIQHQKFEQQVFISPKWMKENRENTDDFIKLANLMKDECDRLQNKFTNNGEVSITGMLVQGFTVKIYVMDLKFSGIYRLYELDEVYIPVSKGDFTRLILTIPACISLRVRLTCFI